MSSLSATPGTAWIDPDPDIRQFGADMLREGLRNIHDIGCGAGRHTLALAGMGLSVVASDIVSESFSEIRRSLSDAPVRARFLCASMIACPLADEVLDGAIAFNVLYHAVKRDMEKATDEVFRTLKPGGLFYLTLATPEHGHYGRGSPIEPDAFVASSGIIHRFMDRDSAIRLLNAFHIESLRETALDYVTQQKETLRCVHWRITARKPVS